MECLLKVNVYINCLATSLLVVLLLSPLALALSVISGPTLTMNPNDTTPLAGMIELTTDVPTRVTLNISSSSATHVYTVELPHLDTEHTIPVLGLKPADSYTIEVTVIDQTDTALVVTPALSTTTDPLPDGFPLIDILASNPAHMEPGFTLLRATTEGPRYTIILDATGDVVWYSHTVVNDNITLGIRLPNGHLLYRSVPRGAILETDLLGNIYARIDLDPEIPNSQLHHEIFRTASGTFLSLIFNVVSVPAYPTSYTDPAAPLGPADIRDTPVVELGADGTLLNRWDFASMLDTTRIGYNALGINGGGRDWTHANAVIEDTRDGSLIASLRHQDAVVKFSRTGQLMWILGPHANWGPTHQPYLLQPVGAPFEWPYHQHNVTITPQGTLLMFDNGNYRASPFDGTTPALSEESYSRAVEYAIDEAKMEIRQIWEYGSPATTDEVLFSQALSGAVRLPQTDNTLITFGHTVYADGVSSAALGFGDLHARIIETDHATAPNTLFDVRLYRPGTSGRLTIYRSYRIPSLYATADGGEVTCNGLEATLVGTAGDDVLEGTAGNDVIIGLRGNDTIYGRGGDDVICGGAGADMLFGGSGNDLLFGGSGNDLLFGDSGNDLLQGGPGSDVLEGYGGNDTLQGGPEPDVLRGGTGVDILWGNGGADVLAGGTQEDELYGGSGQDILLGGDGDDLLQGGPGSDVLEGHGGDDTLFGGNENDILDGGNHFDFCSGGSGTLDTAMACEVKKAIP